MDSLNCNILDPNDLNDIVQAIFTKSPISYMILDKNYRVHFVNNYFSKLHNIPADAVLGSQCYNTFNRQPVVCENCPVREAIATGEQASVARKNILRDGEVRYTDEIAVPLVDENGDFDFILDVHVNRTEERMLHASYRHLFVRIVEILTSILDKKDAYTFYHSRNVTRVAVRLAHFIGMEEKPLKDLYLASLLHDIGKVYTPDAIINKTGRLTEEECRQIRRHPVETYRMLDNLTRFEEIKTIARHHHERWDGEGYPDGLSGEDIPFSSRIIAVADAYDAMTSNRSYRRALSHQHAVEEIRKNAGGQFDPSLARLFGELADTGNASRKEMLDTVADPIQGMKNTQVHIIRKVAGHSSGATGIVNSRRIKDLFAAPAFFKELEGSIPGYLFILDGSLRLVYASEKTRRDLMAERKEGQALRCRDLIHGRECSDSGGREPCPLLRSIGSGLMESGRIAADIDGKRRSFAAMAIPVKLNIEGERRRSYIAILLERTREEEEHAVIEKDIRNLLSKLYAMAVEVNGVDAAGMEAIMRECGNFGEYLSGIKRRLQRLSHTSQLFQPRDYDSERLLRRAN